MARGGDQGDGGSKHTTRQAAKLAARAARLPGKAFPWPTWCEREERSFILVSATARLRAPRSITASTSSVQATATCQQGEQGMALASYSEGRGGSAFAGTLARHAKPCRRLRSCSLACTVHLRAERRRPTWMASGTLQPLRWLFTSCSARCCLASASLTSRSRMDCRSAEAGPAVHSGRQAARAGQPGAVALPDGRHALVHRRAVLLEGRRQACLPPLHTGPCR